MAAALQKKQAERHLQAKSHASRVSEDRVAEGSEQVGRTDEARRHRKPAAPHAAGEGLVASRHLSAEGSTALVWLAGVAGLLLVVVVVISLL